ncbi:MAG: SpoIID/LytB domain-containing protein, partial [Candidatus Wallbacteria bacterium]|nr:SpoIID/LytB domain-containing protein [Candidatus Wallbacteria bacterium]
STRGMVVTYQGRLISSCYHSCCGGATASSDQVWSGGGHPYLEGVACGFCAESPHYSWEYRIDKDRLVRMLNDAGIKCGPEISMEVLETDAAGRAKAVRINGEIVASGKLRQIVGNTKLYSSFFRIFEKEPEYTAMGNLSLEEKVNRIIARYESEFRSDSAKEFIFTGSGNGHGVGLCQWGASGMANQGHTFQEILTKYYKGTKVEKYTPRHNAQQLVKR